MRVRSLLHALPTNEKAGAYSASSRGDDSGVAVLSELLKAAPPAASHPPATLGGEDVPALGLKAGGTSV